MTDAEKLLHRLLDDLEGRLDLQHVGRARARRRAALDYEPLEIPPLVCYLRCETEAFQPYPYPEAFGDPAKMMFNELLAGFTSIYHAVDLRDDAPYCLRPNFGTGIVASMFGAEIVLREDNMPWARPIGPDGARAVLEAPLPETDAGLGRKVREQYEFFHHALEPHPRCREAFEITLPDLQGPFDTAEMLWGSDVFVALHTERDRVVALLDRVSDQMVRVHRALTGLTRDSLSPGAHHQHAVAVKGNLLIRNDTPVLVSAETYTKAIRPFDARLARALGGVAIHFCGDGTHLVDAMLDIPGMQCLDFGQAEMMDLDAIYAKCAPRRVALARCQVPRSDLTARSVRARFPAGASLVYQADSLADAHAAWARYVSHEGE